MMRTLLLLFLTVAFVASSGCGEEKSKKVARSDAPSASGERKRPPKPQGPGIDKGKKEDKKADESKDGEEKEAEAKKKAPPKKSRRRKRPPKPSSGGGPGADTDIAPPATKSKKSDKKADEKKDEEPEEEKFVSFLDRAHKAFERGHEPEAFQYVYAHVLADDDALRQYPMGWYTGINQPRVGLRWGVGISYSPGTFEGDPPTIGNTVLEDDGKRKGGKRKSGGGGGGDFNVGGGGGLSLGGRDRKSASNSRRTSRDSDAKPPMELLTYYTGEFGEKLVERFEMRRRHEDAYYGEVLKSVGEKTSKSGRDEPEKKEKKKKSSGGGGDDFIIAGSGSDLTPGGRNADSDDDADAEYEAEKTGLAPGMMMLGTGSKDEMLKKAQAMNLDVLAFFVVKVKHSERRNGDTSTKSSTQLQLFTVKNGKVLVETKNLSDISVAKARESNRGPDPVEKELDKVFRDNADTAYKAIEIPTKYEASVFKKRFDFLLDKDYDNPLPVLVEMKSYLDLGYISANDYRSACEKYLGETETIDLMDGDVKKKELALRKFLPGDFDFAGDVGETDDFR